MEGIFDYALSGEANKKDLVDAINEAVGDIDPKLKEMSDAIRLAIHDASLKLTTNDIKKLEDIEGFILEARFAVLGIVGKTREMTDPRVDKFFNENEDVME